MTDPMTERLHAVYINPDGTEDECTEDCPGCHWEGNLDCEAILSGCDICDPDGTYAYGNYKPTGEDVDLLGRIVRMWQTHQTFAEKLFARALDEAQREGFVAGQKANR